MYGLYCNIYVHGSWKLELCEVYNDLPTAIDQTVAMWLENDRPVPMFIVNDEGGILTTFSPCGKNGQDVVVLDTSSGNGYRCTDFVYQYDGDKIIATKFLKNGKPYQINH